MNRPPPGLGDGHLSQVQSEFSYDEAVDKCDVEAQRSVQGESSHGADHSSGRVEMSLCHWRCTGARRLPCGVPV